MENLAHSLFGVALGQTRLRHLSPYATTILVLASNLPDIDVVTGFVSDATYLDHHRGVTHSLPGYLIMAPIFALIFTFLGNQFKTFGKPSFQFSQVLLLTSIGLLGHLFFDFLNDYGVRPFLPMADTRFYGSFIFIIEPWFWLFLGSIALLFQPMNKGWLSILTLLILFTFWLLWFLDFDLPYVTRTIYTVFMSGLLIYRFFFQENHPAPRWIIGMSFTLFFSYLIFMLAIRTYTLHELKTSLSEGLNSRYTDINITPEPLTSMVWRTVISTPDSILIGKTLVGDNQFIQENAFPTLLNDEEVKLILETENAKIAQRFSRFLFAQKLQSPDLTTIFLRDARYFRGEFTDFTTLTFELPH